MHPLPETKAPAFTAMFHIIIIICTVTITDKHIYIYNIVYTGNI